jgi:glycosyltransferase involved in cell wall biosynthesis
MAEATRAAAVAFVIPALNEAGTIASVVAGVLAFGQAIVVDDGSSDRTGELARGAGAQVLRHPHRRGYDAALTLGIQHACDAGFDWAVTMDADGQHASSNLPRVLASLAGVDLVVGYRSHRPRFSENLMAYVFVRLWGVRDPLCGLKAYRLELYRSRRMHGKTYASIGTEIMLQYLHSGARVAQIPIVIESRADAPRFGNRIAANARILASLFLSLAKSWSRAP